MFYTFICRVFVYVYISYGWKNIANLQDPAGPQGTNGSGGSGGSSGSGSDTDGKGKSAQGGKLPKTATSLPTLILIGALLASFSSM
ncbi:hypothetical protein [Pueribacillus sp. YX66]|uniref:hypothetical protein n=1 Tax=Pueribacillus sp. YX66 TaxID=3229242 RepID=UPI00358D556C